MADNVTVDNGALTDYVVGADERSIGGTNVQIQRTYDMGATSGSSGQTTVTNSSTTIKAADETRKRIILVNRQTVAVFIDPSGGTATTSMFRLDPGDSVTLYVTGAITGITSAAYSASGDAKVHYIVETAA